MSRPWKSELLVRLGRSACTVQRCAPWTRRVLAEATAEGPPEQALPQALAALRTESGEPLPRQARLLVPDERVYLSLRAAASSWPVAQREALAHFAATLGRQDLAVQVAPMPGMASWLAAAIEPDDLRSWQGLLAAAGVRLTRAQLMLLDDLRWVAGSLADEAVVALLREEGLTLLRIESGAPIELSWERCDPRAQRLVEQRLLAFQGAIVSSEPAPLWLLCRTATQREQWQAFARAHRWQLLLRDAAQAEQPVPEPMQVPT